MEKCDIDPYVGVGEIEFGMSSHVVSKLIGPPVSTDERSAIRGLDPDYARYYRGLTIEFRSLPANKEPIISFRNDQAELMDFIPAAKNLCYKGIFLFKLNRSDVVERLMAESHVVFKDREGLKFLDLGITLSSKDHYRDNPNIGIFCRGHFDALIEKGVREGRGEMVRGDYRPASQAST